MKIVKSNQLLKKGQFLVKAEDGTLYEVAEVKLVKGEKGYKHRLSLKEAEYPPTGEGVSYPNPNIHLVDLDEEEILSQFGIGRKGKILPGLITEAIKDAFEKAGRIDDFDPSLDYDKILKGFAYKQLRKSIIPIDPQDQEDMIINVVLQTINPKTVKKYDESRDVIKYFAGMFQKRLLNEIKSYVNTRINEVQNQFEDFTDEEAIDYLKETGGEILPREDTQEEILEYKDLVKDITKYLKDRKLVDVFELLLQGYSNTEIAEKLGTSVPAISQRLDKIRKLLYEYARKTDNDLLSNLLVEFSKTKKHADDEVSNIYDVFQRYKKKVGWDEPEKISIKPVGEVVKIKKVDLGSDKMDEDYLTESWLNRKPSSELQDELEAFLANIYEHDELIEEDGKIIGLKIVDNPRTAELAKGKTLYKNDQRVLIYEDEDKGEKGVQDFYQVVVGKKDVGSSIKDKSGMWYAKGLGEETEHTYSCPFKAAEALLEMLPDKVFQSSHQAGKMKELQLQIEEWMIENENKMSKDQLLKVAQKKFLISSENAEYIWDQLHDEDYKNFLSNLKSDSDFMIERNIAKSLFDSHLIEVWKEGPVYKYKMVSYADGFEPEETSGKGAMFESIVFELLRRVVEDLGGENNLDIWVDKQNWMPEDFAEIAIKWAKDTPYERLISKFKRIK